MKSVEVFEEEGIFDLWTNVFALCVASGNLFGIRVPYVAKLLKTYHVVTSLAESKGAEKLLRPRIYNGCFFESAFVIM